MQVRDLVGGNVKESFTLEEAHARAVLSFPRWKDLWLFNESTTYQMLLRGNAPQSEPFRKWVTEVVLPAIRKTGKFDVNEAQDETSQQFAGQFAKKTLDLIRNSPMIAPLSPVPSVRAPTAKGHRVPNVTQCNVKHSILTIFPVGASRYANCYRRPPRVPSSCHPSQL